MHGHRSAHGLCAAYLAAVVLANLLVAWLGPSMAIVNALVFIGLDMTVRDCVHDVWAPEGGWSLSARLGGLIAAGSIMTAVLCPGASRVAEASAAAFALSAVADAAVYHALRGRPYLERVNGSNIVGAAVDSALFAPLAFGVVAPLVMVGQFAAKVAGGAVWALWLRGDEGDRA